MAREDAEALEFLSVRIPKRLKRAIRQRALDLDLKIQAYVRDAIERDVQTDGSELRIELEAVSQHFSLLAARLSSLLARG